MLPVFIIWLVWQPPAPPPTDGDTVTLTSFYIYYDDDVENPGMDPQSPEPMPEDPPTYEIPAPWDVDDEIRGDQQSQEADRIKSSWSE